MELPGMIILERTNNKQQVTSREMPATQPWPFENWSSRRLTRKELVILSSGTLGVAEVIDVDASDVTQASEPLLIVGEDIRE